MNNQSYITKFLSDSFKICKHEIRASRKLSIITIVLIVGNILLTLSPDFNFVQTIIAIQFFSFFAFMVIYILSATASFYHGVFGKNSYLTHSLPVHLDSILLSKIFVFLLWALIGYCLVFLFVYKIGFLYYKGVFIDIFFSYLFWFILMSIQELTFIFMVVALVHRKKTHILMYGIVTYFSIKILLLLFITVFFNNMYGYEYFTLESVFICMSVFLSIVYYSICRYIVKNKLSL